MRNSLLSIVIILGSLSQMCALKDGNQKQDDHTDGSDESTIKDMEKFITKIIPKISYRLVSKDWSPKDHPSGDIQDEYQGGWEKAFAAMLREYYPYKARNVKDAEELFTLKGDLGQAEYDKNLQSILIFHPLNGQGYSNFVRAAITALRLRNLHKKYNMFAVDMPDMNLQLYIEVFKQVTGSKNRYEEIAQVLSMLITKGIDGGHWRPSDIHLMGFSVTGNLMGYIGRHIYTKYKEKLGSILSLDPYSNEQNPYFIHLSKDDALFVHVYHSNSFNSGTRERIATADFVFNGGRVQPECRNKFKYPNPYGCSHKKIALRLWYIILFPSTFKARKCDTWTRFEQCFCEGEDEATITYPIEQNPARGTYQIITTGQKPYGLGEAGAHCDPKKKNKAFLLQKVPHP